MEDWNAGFGKILKVEVGCFSFSLKLNSSKDTYWKFVFSMRLFDPAIGINLGRAVAASGIGKDGHAATRAAVGQVVNSTVFNKRIVRH